MGKVGWGHVRVTCMLASVSGPSLVSAGLPHDTAGVNPQCYSSKHTHTAESLGGLRFVPPCLGPCAAALSHGHPTCSMHQSTVLNEAVATVKVNLQCHSSKLTHTDE